MWNSNSDTDLLDFALLWQPLGGPSPEHVTAAFSIDIREYNDKVRAAARRQLARLRTGTTLPAQIYGLSTITALEHACPGTSPDGRKSSWARPQRLVTTFPPPQRSSGKSAPPWVIATAG